MGDTSDRSIVPWLCSEPCSSKMAGQKIVGAHQERKDSAALGHERMSRSQASQDLFVAATYGDIPTMAVALEAHGDPNACNADGLAPLTVAAAGGHVQGVLLLLDSGAMPDGGPSAHGLSPLGVAAAQGNLEVMKALLRARANVSLGAKQGKAALMRAAAAGHVDASILLIEASAPVDACDHNGVSALMLAVEKGREETIMLLLSRNASASHADKHQRSALARAVDMLFRMSTQKANMTPFWAPIDRWIFICRELAHHAADPNMINDAGETLLSRAVRHRRNDITELLLDIGAVPDQAVPALKNGSVLILASRTGCLEICKTLIERMASVDFRDRRGDNALSSATTNGNEDIALLLMDHGAKPIKRAAPGLPLVVHAAENGCGQLYSRLLIHNHVPATRKAKQKATDGQEKPSRAE